MVGVSYLVAILIAAPVGVFSPTASTRCSTRSAPWSPLVGFSVPTFFTGTVLIVIFSGLLGWLPSIYDTTRRVTGVDWLDHFR